MILETVNVKPEEFERRTGWSIKPEGACKGEICVPIAVDESGLIDVRVAAKQLDMPILRDEESGIWCLGPEALGLALTTTQAPELALPDWRGKEFRLSYLRGTKVLLVAWASW